MSVDCTAAKAWLFHSEILSSCYSDIKLNFRELPKCEVQNSPKVSVLDLDYSTEDEEAESFPR